MISVKILKDYEFKNVDEYYDYIFTSVVNGNRDQARKLIKKLSKDEKKEAYKYIGTFKGKEAEETQSLIFDAL